MEFAGDQPLKLPTTATEVAAGSRNVIVTRRCTFSSSLPRVAAAGDELLVPVDELPEIVVEFVRHEIFLVAELEEDTTGSVVACVLTSTLFIPPLSDDARRAGGDDRARGPGDGFAVDVENGGGADSKRTVDARGAAVSITVYRNPTLPSGSRGPRAEPAVVDVHALAGSGCQRELAERPGVRVEKVELRLGRIAGIESRLSSRGTAPRTSHS